MKIYNVDVVFIPNQRFDMKERGFYEKKNFFHYHGIDFDSCDVYRLQPG